MAANTLDSHSEPGRYLLPSEGVCIQTVLFSKSPLLVEMTSLMVLSGLSDSRYEIRHCLQIPDSPHLYVSGNWVMVTMHHVTSVSSMGIHGKSCHVIFLYVAEPCHSF